MTWLDAYNGSPARAFSIPLIVTQPTHFRLQVVRNVIGHIDLHSRSFGDPITNGLKG